MPQRNIWDRLGNICAADIESDGGQRFNACWLDSSTCFPRSALQIEVPLGDVQVTDVRRWLFLGPPVSALAEMATEWMSPSRCGEHTEYIWVPKICMKGTSHTNCRGWWWCNSGWIRVVFRNLVVVLIHLLDTLPFLSLWSSQASCSQQACQWDHGFERKSQWLHLMFSRAATSIPPTTYSVLTMVVIPVLEKHQSISIAYWCRLDFRMGRHYIYVVVWYPLNCGSTTNPPNLAKHHPVPPFPTGLSFVFPGRFHLHLLGGHGLWTWRDGRNVEDARSPARWRGNSGKWEVGNLKDLKMSLSTIECIHMYILVIHTYIRTYVHREEYAYRLIDYNLYIIL